MNIHCFYHSLVSDWNHGNAHFLRGIAGELIRRGHTVHVHEPADGWSRRHLEADHGPAAVARFHASYPHLRSTTYDPHHFDPAAGLADADLVLVHEWTDPALVRRIGAARNAGDFVLLYHDTHHRLVTEPERIDEHLLDNYDGVLAYGRSLRDRYLETGLARRAWTWHEAADTRVFHPRPRTEDAGDVVWIGNWGDDERTAELREFLIDPVRELGLRARVYGVRYPTEAQALLAKAGIAYAGWLPNFDVPSVFANFRVTIHVPRRPYTRLLRGIPTIRPFEAMACGIPLITAPWADTEGLFQAGRDYLLARNGAEMRRHLRLLLDHPARADALARHARAAVRTRHTCAHRVDELLAIVRSLRGGANGKDTDVVVPAATTPEAKPALLDPHGTSVLRRAG